MLKFRFSTKQLLEGQGVCREERAVLGRANCGDVEADRARDDGGGGLQSDQVRELAQIRIRYGNLCLHVLLRRGGWALGKDQTYRLYTEESLQLRSKRPRRRKMADARRERYVPKRPN